MGFLLKILFKDFKCVKGIDPVVSPELLKILCEMGHGSEILFADGNF